MSYERLPYADAETPHTMSTDCLEVQDHLPGQRREVETADLFEGALVPGSTFTAVQVPDSLARLAGEMELHFD